VEITVKPQEDDSRRQYKQSPQLFIVRGALQPWLHANPQSLQSSAHVGHGLCESTEGRRVRARGRICDGRIVSETCLR